MRRLPKGFSLRKATVPGRQEKSMGEQKYLMALRQQGCTNRPFYHIVITKSTYPIRSYIYPFEQVGTFDPFPNRHGEKLCGLNIERIMYYLARGIEVEESVQQLLGLAGLLPQHPNTYQTAWRNRRELNRVTAPSASGTEEPTSESESAEQQSPST